MSLKIWFLAVAVCAGFEASFGAVLGRSKLTEEGDFVVKGGLVHEKTETENNCRRVKTTATLPDGSTSTVDEDFDSGFEVIRISNDTETCFVRMLTAKDYKDAENCMQANGQDDTEDDVEEEDLEEGAEVPAEMLSPAQREQCEGKRIVKLVPRTDSPSEEGEEPRQKRGCSMYYYWVRVKYCYVARPWVCFYRYYLYRRFVCTGK